MPKFLVIILFFSLYGCKQKNNNVKYLTKQVDSLQHKLQQVYTPGMGEFMGSIQTHHSKLWFAGQSNNWLLADFEIHEMMEAIENIQNYNKHRPESKLLGTLTPAINNLKKAIENKDVTNFKAAFILLTNNCNNCHKATNFEFNRVQIPTVNPFSNQNFDKNN